MIICHQRSRRRLAASSIVCSSYEPRIAPPPRSCYVIRLSSSLVIRHVCYLLLARNKRNSFAARILKQATKRHDKHTLIRHTSTVIINYATYINYNFNVFFVAAAHSTYLFPSPST